MPSSEETEDKAAGVLELNPDEEMPESLDSFRPKLLFYWSKIILKN